MQFVIHKNKKNINEIAFYSSILILFLLSSLNLYIVFSSTKVLGTSTESLPKESKSSFWTSFLEKHPEYIPGWIELKNEDKVNKIDPNYIIP